MVPSLAQGVIEHMNEDHSDAVLLYVKAFGGIEDATEAHMTSIDFEAMELAYQTPAGSGHLKVLFDPPLAEFGEIRPRLVAMIADARRRVRGDEDQ